jgi:D-glycero-D-manno-heptose 1,7-bisphosphate phosphatase|tara:strand:+ start:1461 stop:2012 length:552 start_codon:yes stop_codon:yes gene_type:complete
MDKQFDAIFLDRDGTISHDPYGYINSLSDYHFFDYTFKALEIFKKYTDKFIIVTNQSGLSSGKIDIENLQEINSFIYKEFENRNLPLKKIYFSTNYSEGYDSMRKPGIGMFVKAKDDFNIDLSKSLMIGDSIVDMQVGERLDMKTIFLLTGMGQDYLNEVRSKCKVHLISNNLLEAAKDLISI